jgi:hypothetical protein
MAPMFFARKALLFAPLLAIPGTVGCNTSEEKAVEYGEPVGITIEASAKGPGLEIAFAATKGVPIDSLVPTLAGAVHGAVQACPAFVAERASGDVAQLAFAVEKGAVTRLSQGRTPGETCLVSKLQGAPISSAQNVEVLAELRLKQPAGAAP